MRDRSINDATPEEWDKLNRSYEDEPPIFTEGSSYHLRDIQVQEEVDNPPHYNKGNVECIEAIESMLTSEEYIGYLRGNSLKYRWRFRYKGKPVADLLKADWYEQRLLNFYTKNNLLNKSEKSSGYGTEGSEDC